MQHYLNKNRTPSTGDSVREIRLACVHGDITTVQTFLRHLQIDVGRTYSDLSALLLLACRNGQANIAQLLLDHGAKINQTGYLGETALSAACNMGHKDIVELLLKTPGVEVDTAPNPSQRTPLIQACQKGYVDIARLLLNHGANPDLPDKQGKTALDYAFEMGHENVIELLLNIPGAFTWRRSNYELLYRLKKRGYALSGRGVCNGVAETSGQEFLFYEDSEKFVTMFNQRYELLLSFNREKFSEELDRYYSSHPEKKQEIEPFLDSVALQQDPNVFSYLFDEDADVTQSNRNAAPLFTPTNKSTERKEGKDTSIMTFASFSGVYDDEELTVYLNLLQEHLGAHRFSMVLRSNQHAINLNYDPDKKKWFLINANTLPISRIVGTEILTQNILKGFFSNTNAIISTRISCQEHEADNFQEKFEELKTDSRWKAIHNPKKPSAISVSKKGSTWLNIACQNKEIETVRLLLTESNIDINKADSYGYTPLSNVCRNGCTPIFKLLLEQ